jgi:signal peptidase I
MWMLAAVASFIFPGAGQGLTRDVRRAAAWAIAGLVPVLLLLWLPQAAFAFLAVRLASAVDAWIVVRRASPNTRHFTFAGAVALLTLFVLVQIRLFVLEVFVPNTSSMAPTLTIGDQVFTDKLTPRFTGYHRGEIAVFDHPMFDAKYIKRIAAVGGDTVAVRDGVLYVNGVAKPQTALGNARYWDAVDGSWSQREVAAYREDLDGHVHTIFRLHRMPSEKYLEHDYPRPGVADGEDPCAARTVPGGRPSRAPAMTLTADGTACTVPPGTYFFLGDNRDNSNDSRSWGAVPASSLIGRAIGNWWSSNAKTGVEWSRIGRVE